MKLLFCFIVIFLVLYMLQNLKQLETFSDKSQFFLTKQNGKFFLWENNTILRQFESYNEYLKFYKISRPHYLQKGIDYPLLKVTSSKSLSLNAMDSNWYDSKIPKKIYNIEFFESNEPSCKGLSESDCTGDKCAWCINTDENGIQTGKCVKGDENGVLEDVVCNSGYFYKGKCIYGDDTQKGMNCKRYIPNPEIDNSTTTTDNSNESDSDSSSSNSSNNTTSSSSNNNNNSVNCSVIDISKLKKNNSITNLLHKINQCKLSSNEEETYSDWLKKQTGKIKVIKCNNSNLILKVKEITEGHYAGNKYLVNVPNIRSVFTDDLKNFLCNYADSIDEINWIPNKPSNSGGTIIIIKSSNIHNIVKMKVDINGFTIPGSFVNSLHDDRDTTYKNLDINYNNNTPISESQRLSNCKTFCEGEDENGDNRPCTVPCRNWKCSNCPITQNSEIPDTTQNQALETSTSTSTSISENNQQSDSYGSNTQSNTYNENPPEISYNRTRQQESQPVQNSNINNNRFSHMEPSKKMAQAYGWSYIPPYFWSVPQRRPPACIPQKGFESKVASIYDKSVPLDALQYTEGGSILPKFRYEEEYNPKYYYPGWKSK